MKPEGRNNFVRILISVRSDEVAGRGINRAGEVKNARVLVYRTQTPSFWRIVARFSAASPVCLKYRLRSSQIRSPL